MAAFLETTGWTVVAVMVWLTTLSAATLPEVCFALGAGVLCGSAASAGRRALGGAWRFRLRWLLWIFPLTGSILAETADLCRAAVIGPRPGRMSEYELPDDPVEILMGREALGTLAMSATPGSVVADCDPERRRLVAHVLLSAGPRVEEAIRR